MELIPAIDLLDGKCVRLTQGDYQRKTEFNSNPLTQALEWQSQGAKRIHLVDLDAAKTGLPVNDLIIKEISASLDIPIQIGGGIRTIKRAQELIKYGLDKVILGTVAIEKPELVSELSEQYPGKVLVGIDAKDGRVATRGWINKSEVLATELAKSFNGTELAGIISTDISTDGTLKGPNLASLKEIADSSNKPIIASGGIGSIADLISLIPLEQNGVNAVIVGRALYEGSFKLVDGIKAIASPRLQDFNPGNKSLA